MLLYSTPHSFSLLTRKPPRIPYTSTHKQNGSKKLTYLYFTVTSTIRYFLIRQRESLHFFSFLLDSSTGPCLQLRRPGYYGMEMESM